MQGKSAKIVIGVVAIVIVAALAIYVFPSSKPRVLVVASDDGRASLEIPKGSLPEGVTVGDVSIAKESENTTNGVVVYNLKPDGLALNEAATFVSKVNTDGEEGFTIPTFIHLSDEFGEENVTSTAVHISKEGEVTASFPVSHFSRIIERSSGFLEYTPLTGFVFTGQTFEMGYRITATGNEDTYEGTRYSDGREPLTSVRKILEPSSLIVDGIMLKTDNNAVSPQEVVLPSGNYPVAEGYRGTQTILCEAPTPRMGTHFYPNPRSEPLRVEFDVLYTATRIGEQLPYIDRISTYDVQIFDSRIPFRCERIPDDYELVDPLTLEVGPEGNPNARPMGDDVKTISVTDGQGRVLMVVIDGNYYPENQFYIGAAGAPENPPHNCNRPHYHAVKGDIVYGLLGTDLSQNKILPDAHPTTCGYGLFDDLERVHVPLTDEQRKTLLENISSI